MKKLTVKYAIDHKFNHIDLVKYFNPKLDDEICDIIIWEETCYPFSLSLTIDTLNKMFITRIPRKIKKLLKNKQ